MTGDETRGEEGPSVEEKQGGGLEQKWALGEGVGKEMKGTLKPVMSLEKEEEF